jgi:hypothetical protein
LAETLKLAITRIGDLLLHDTISQDGDGNSINSIRLNIPDYQRPYKWSAKNAIQLLDDIIDAINSNKETYRVGTLILHFDKKQSHYNIVDGQQRTITFSLLLMALGAGGIGFLEQTLSANPYNTRNVPNNYRALERRVKSIIDAKDRKTLLDYVQYGCELIVVMTEDLSEAFQLFDSQNARGKKLYPHDLLKAYHLREMTDLDIGETEKVVKGWEDLDQRQLSSLFSDYLYRVKEWIKGNKAWELTERNIHKFKGITRNDNFPYAQFYKGAFAFADSVNQSPMPFVSGTRNLKPFQLDTPIVAGKPFFEYAKHYFAILEDIQNNDKYEGYLIRDNDIVKTLDLRKYKNGVGNQITRLLFDTSILLYVDRFCPDRPGRVDLDMLEQFVVFAFVWAYSLRAQYQKVGWQTAQNYVMGNDVLNSFNLYGVISSADSPTSLLSSLSDMVNPLPISDLIEQEVGWDEKDEAGIYQNYLHYFKSNNFIEGEL